MRGLLIYDFTFARHRERLMMEVWRFRIGGVIVVRCGWERWRTVRAGTTNTLAGTTRLERRYVEGADGCKRW